MLTGSPRSTFFVVPTILFKLLYGLLILRHDRRRILWVGVTPSPTGEWIARQVSEACGWEPVPDYLVRDRDRVYGEAFTRRIRAMGIRDRPTAPRSPWQNGYAERLIGSIRRECLDHVIVFGERHLRHLLRSYQQYYRVVTMRLAKLSPLSIGFASSAACPIAERHMFLAICVDERTVARRIGVRRIHLNILEAAAAAPLSMRRCCAAILPAR